jgi:RNA polymerase sigma-70 factor (ECF subfamily)
MNAQLSLALDDPFDLAVAPVLASEAFADLCRTLTREPIADAVATRAQQLRHAWDPTSSATAWCHALAIEVARERKQARREYERAVVPMRSSLYGAAMNLVRDPSEADDLVQDVMLRAWRFWASFQQGTDLKAWLFAILRNTFINGYHRAGRSRDFQADVSEHVRALGSEAAVGLSHAAPATDAETLIDARAEQARVLAALARLPQPFQDAVAFADIDGLSYKEIAEIMGCPIGTVMSRIYRGRAQMRVLLGAVS